MQIVCYIDVIDQLGMNSGTNLIGREIDLGSGQRWGWKRDLQVIYYTTGLAFYRPEDGTWEHGLM